MPAKRLNFEDVNVGDPIPPLEKPINTVNMAMYGAATWDFHRYHYDSEYVQKMGFPKPFVDGQMLGAFLAQLLTDWIGIGGTLKKLSCRYTAFVYPGDTLTCKGSVTSKRQEGGEGLVECELWIENQRGERVLDRGGAVVILPGATSGER